MAILIRIIEAAVARIAADEVKAWLPWLSDRLLNLAVNRLPHDQRERFREEWAADLECFPSGIAQVVRACGMVWAGWMVGDLIPEKVRMSVAQIVPILAKYGVYLTGLVILGGTLAAIWGKFQTWKAADIRVCTILGFFFGLIVASTVCVLIVRHRVKVEISADLHK